MSKVGISVWGTALLVGVMAAPPSGTSKAAQAVQPPSAQAGPQEASSSPAEATSHGKGRPVGPEAHNIKEWVQGNSRAARGAVLGALGGAVLGALTARAHGGSAWKGAAIGGVAGGIAGYALGRNQDKLAANRDQAIRLAEYAPAQGYLLRLDAFHSEPATVAPGGSVTLSVRYLVIGPDPRERLTVHYFRGIKYQDAYLNGNGPTSFEVPNGGGIVSATWTMDLPKDAPAGTYAVEELIEDPQGRFHVTATTPLYIAPANG